MKLFVGIVIMAIALMMYSGVGVRLNDESEMELYFQLKPLSDSFIILNSGV